MRVIDWASVFIRKDEDRSLPLDPVIPLDTIISLRAVTYDAQSVTAVTSLTACLYVSGVAMFFSRGACMLYL